MYVSIEKGEWKFDTLCEMYGTFTTTQGAIWNGEDSNCQYLFDFFDHVASNCASVFSQHPWRLRFLVLTTKFMRDVVRILVMKYIDRS